MLETSFREKIILVQKRGQPTYCLNSNSQIWLWYYRFSHVSNVWVVKASKLVDRINLREIASPNDGPYSSNSKPDNKSYNVNIDNKPTIINKTTENNLKYIKQLCRLPNAPYIREIDLRLNAGFWFH